VKPLRKVTVSTSIIFHLCRNLYKLFGGLKIRSKLFKSFESSFHRTQIALSQDYLLFFFIDLLLLNVSSYFCKEDNISWLERNQLSDSETTLSRRLHFFHNFVICYKSRKQSNILTESSSKSF